jgi:hypothetical protein
MVSHIADMNTESAPPERRGFSGLQVTGIVLLTVLVTLLAGAWLVRTYLFPAPLDPVELSQVEQATLTGKLRVLGIERPVASGGRGEQARAMPEPYSEAGASRDVEFTERELNGLIAEDSELARNFAVDLSDDLVSFTMLVPVPPDFPVMPGRIVRVNGGAEVAFADGRPVVALRGISLMGVPVPNAWLGNLKNVDLVGEFGDSGFWKAFADGVQSIRVEDGVLRVTLRE